MIESRTQEQIYECKKAQLDFTEKNKLPHFAPLNGICFACNRDIYQVYEIDNRESKGIDIERAGKVLITDCPHCRYSYCD